MKTIMFVLALAAAPTLFSQVASQLHLGGSSLSVGFQYAPSPRALVAHERAYFAAARFPDHIAFVSTDGTTAGTRTHAGAWPGVYAVSALGTALGQVFYTTVQFPGAEVDLRCAGPACDVVLETLPAGSEVGTVIEMGGFAWFVVSGTGGSSLLCRSDGTPGSVLDMVLVGGQARLWAAFGPRLLLTSTGHDWLRVVNTGGLLMNTSLVDIPTHGGTTIEMLGHWGGWIYYWLEDSARRELHRSNGVVAETVCLLCRPPAYQGPFAPEPVIHEGLMYFLARGDAGINQLWRTNGTPQGTGPLTAQELHGQVLPGLKVFNGAVHFATYMGYQGAVWKTDGTPQGTINVVAEASFDGEPAFVRDGHLYMLGTSLWRLDSGGRTFRRVKVQLKGSPMGRFRQVYAELDSRILLADQGLNLWTLDLNASRDRTSPASCTAGTAPGWPVLALACLLAVAAVRRRRRIESRGPAVGRARTLVLVFAPVLVSASPLHGEQATRLVFHGAPVQAYGAGGTRTVLHGDSRYLAASTAHGDVLLRFHPMGGMVAATPVQDVIHPDSVGVALGSVFYQGHGGLRRTNGYPHGDVIVDGVDACPVVELGGLAYYIVQWPGEVELRSTTGGPASGRRVTAMPGQLTFAGRIYVVGSRLVLFVQHTGGLRLYSSDGTAAGTTLIFSQEPELAGGALWHSVLAASSNELGFNISRSWDSSVTRLKTDGKSVEPLPSSSIILPAESSLDGFFYFVTSWGSSYRDLWSSDGTPEGTRQVTNVYEHGSVMGTPLIHNGAVYLATEWGAEGSIWRVKGGLPARVYHKVDARFEGRPVMGVGGNLYLLQEDGRTLWRADVSADAARMAEIPVEFPGTPDAQIRNVLLATDDGVLVVDTMNRVWMISLSSPSSGDGAARPEPCGAGPL